MREVAINVGLGVCAVGCMTSLIWGLHGVYQNLTEPNLVTAAITNPVVAVVSTHIETPVVVLAETPKTVEQSIEPVSSGCVRVSFTVVTGVVPPR